MLEASWGMKEMERIAYFAFHSRNNHEKLVLIGNNKPLNEYLCVYNHLECVWRSSDLLQLIYTWERTTWYRCFIACQCQKPTADEVIAFVNTSNTKLPASKQRLVEIKRSYCEYHITSSARRNSNRMATTTQNPFEIQLFWKVRKSNVNDLLLIRERIVIPEQIQRSILMKLHWDGKM